MHLVLLLLISVAVLLLAHTVVGDVVEKATGHKFASTQGFWQLAGVGVRVKQLGPISAKVYAAGLYAPKGEVSAKVKSSKCTSAADVLAHMNKASLMNDGALVLKMARDVKADTMAGALSDAIKPRMGGKDAAGLEKLRKIIVDALPAGCVKNSELKFVCNGSGSVQVTINGRHRGDIQSMALSKAFLATYCDKAAVSASLRGDMAANIWAWSK